jgi:3-hydroxybutyryl-CoA dehydrogenase
MDGNQMSVETPALADIRRVGVIGAGQMGNGIAHVCALAGYDVVLADVKPEQLKKSLDTINRNMERQVKRSVLSEQERDAALGRIKTTVNMADVSDCDIVIEAATENEQVKRDILKAVTSQLKKSAIVATNT